MSPEAKIIEFSNPETRWFLLVMTDHDFFAYKCNTPSKRQRMQQSNVNDGIPEAGHPSDAGLLVFKIVAK